MGSTFPRRLGLALCMATGIGLLITYVVVLLTGDISPRRTDFIAFYSGSRAVLQGHSTALYDFSALTRIEKAIVHPYVLRYGVLPYVYPPFLALALTPLAALPYTGAYVCWAAFSALVLALTLLAIQRYAQLTCIPALFLWIAGVSFLPAFIALVQGQVSFVLLGAIGASVVALRRDRDRLAGATLSVVLIKPQYVLPILLVLVLHKRWTALAAFTCSAIVLAIVPTVYLGMRINADYVHVLRLAATWHDQFGYSPELNASFAGLLAATLPSGAAGVTTALLDTAAVAAVAWCALRSRNLDLTLALAIIVGLLTSPHVLVHDLVLLLVPVGLTLRYRKIGAPKFVAVLACAYALTLLGFAAQPLIHAQLAVLAMTAIGIWILTAAIGPLSREDQGPESTWSVVHAH